MRKNPSPKIDDQFWFDYSEVLVNEAVSRRDAAGQRFQELVVWLWGIFSAYAVAAISITDVDLTLKEKAFVAGTSATLFAVYWLAVWVQMPSNVYFDPRSPELIRASYERSIKQKNLKLGATLTLSLIGAVFVALSFLIISTAPTNTPADPPMMGLRSVLTESGGKTYLQLFSKIDVVDTARICVSTDACPIAQSPRADTCAFICKPFSPSHEGTIHHAFEFQGKVPDATVKIAWTDEEGVEREVRKIVALPSH